MVKERYWWKTRFQRALSRLLGKEWGEGGEDSTNNHRAEPRLGNGDPREDKQGEGASIGPVVGCLFSDIISYKHSMSKRKKK